VADERDAVEPERVDHRLEILLSVGTSRVLASLRSERPYPR
jgi:hypothetical protein